jgi:hypothetical protein
MFKRMRGTSEPLLDSYLAEFMCRSDYVDCIFICITEQYKT